MCRCWAKTRNRFNDLLEDCDCGCVIPKEEERAISVVQLKRLCAHISRRCLSEGWRSTNPKLKNKALHPDSVTLYDACHYVILPATDATRRSYVEFVAHTPQKPDWFVSHWWGEAVTAFTRCLRQHSLDHYLTMLYWVCAYANNQYSLDNAVTADPADSSFVKAIHLAQGKVLSVLDADGVVFTRVWCCLEISMGLEGIYEIYTAPVGGCLGPDQASFDRAEKLTRSEGSRRISHLLSKVEDSKRDAVGITFGIAKSDGNQKVQLAIMKAKREAAFPIELVACALDIRIQNAESTREADKRHILNYIAKRPLDMPLDSEAHCAAYEVTNRKLHGRFAAAAWRLILEQGKDLRKCAEALSISGLSQLELSMRGCVKFTDADVKVLAEALPPTLTSLKLEFEGTELEERISMSSSVSKGGGAPVLAKVMQQGDFEVGFEKLANLRSLCLPRCALHNCSIPAELEHCKCLERLYLESNGLTGSIPPELGECAGLRRVYIFDNDLTGSVPSSLGMCLNLERLYIGHNQLSGELPEQLGSCRSLRRLFVGNCQLSGEIPKSLGQLLFLEALFLGSNMFTGQIPKTLGECVQLRALSLHMNQLEGAVPEILCQCRKLKLLSLHDNRLTGKISSELQEIKHFSAHNNQFDDPSLNLASSNTEKDASELGWDIANMFFLDDY